MAMLNLKQGLDHNIDIEGVVYTMDLSYDNVIRWFDLITDEDYNDEERIVVAFRMFVPDCPNNTDIKIKILAMEGIANYLKGSSDDEEEQPQSDEDLIEYEHDNTEYFNFDEDADYIFGAFMQAYGIDIIEQRGKLSWEKFMALFNSLPDDTKFSEIISIRARELPSGNESHEKAERDRLIKLKEVYKLKSSQSVVEQEIDNMFASIMQTAITQKGGQSNE